jgi:hypothetical protein
LTRNAGSVVGVPRRSVVGCASPANPPDTIGSRRPAGQRPAWSGLRPRGQGVLLGVVARSDVDAVPDGAGQGGGPVVGHDGGDRLGSAQAPVPGLTEM